MDSGRGQRDKETRIVKQDGDTGVGGVEIREAEGGGGRSTENADTITKQGGKLATKVL